MQGADTVNDEFEVGYNQDFEAAWYRAELVGRVVMVIFVGVSLLGFLGRGPFSHETIKSADGNLIVDYEPIARHGTATTVTVHVKNLTDAEESVKVTLDQHVVEPMGFSHAIPTPDGSSVSDAGVRLDFREQPHQSNALVRFALSPTALGFIPVSVSDGQDKLKWTMLVAP